MPFCRRHTCAGTTHGLHTDATVPATMATSAAASCALTPAHLVVPQQRRHATAGARAAVRPRGCSWSERSNASKGTRLRATLHALVASSSAGGETRDGGGSPAHVNAIIIGGSSGMGKAAAKEVVRQGGRVLLGSRSMAKVVCALLGHPHNTSASYARPLLCALTGN